MTSSAVWVPARLEGQPPGESEAGGPERGGDSHARQDRAGDGNRTHPEERRLHEGRRHGRLEAKDTMAAWDPANARMTVISADAPQRARPRSAAIRRAVRSRVHDDGNRSDALRAVEADVAREPTRMGDGQGRAKRREQDGLNCGTHERPGTGIASCRPPASRRIVHALLRTSFAVVTAPLPHERRRVCASARSLRGTRTDGLQPPTKLRGRPSHPRGD